MDRFDVCIVGAGAIGLAIAQRLSAAKALANRSIVVLEQESAFGRHTSSRNSEVIHAGIYYPQYSLKANLCVKGNQLLYAHCQQYDIPFRQIGKFIVAQAGQESQLQELTETASRNGVDDLLWTSAAQLKKQEPAIRANSALFSPSTGIVDSHAYMQNLLQLAQMQSVQFAPYTKVLTCEPQNERYRVRSEISVKGSIESYEFETNTLINSAGLYAQELATRITGLQQSSIPKLYPCKGDYFSYCGKSPFTHLVYPLPEQHATGLGIHATLDVAGRLRFGPDTEYIDSVHYAIDAGKAEKFAHAIASYFPDIQASKLSPDYSGVRPKLSAPGASAEDFKIQESLPGLIQLFGMESPGLTASLAIGDYVTDKLVDYFG